MDDISFEINSKEGDRIKVALSNYEEELILRCTDDPHVLALKFYDVALMREAGEDYVSYVMLSAVSDVLARFMHNRSDAVLCFYCDAHSDVRRNHSSISPQEYRSRLFSRMFDNYTHKHNLDVFVNHCVRIKVDDNSLNDQFAHFICRKEHEDIVMALGQALMDDK